MSFNQEKIQQELPTRNMRNTLPEKIAFCYFVYSQVMTSVVQILKALVIHFCQSVENEFIYMSD